MTDLPPKALSIRQPWAWAIIHAGKDIENREWKTKFRGPVCIHAAKSMTRDEYGHAERFMHMFAIETPDRDAMWMGGIVGMAEIVDCVDASNSPWFFGTYGFVLRKVRPVEFIPVKGALGFFDWRKNLEARND